MPEIVRDVNDWAVNVGRKYGQSRVWVATLQTCSVRPICFVAIDDARLSIEKSFGERVHWCESAQPSDGRPPCLFAYVGKNIVGTIEHMLYATYGVTMPLALPEHYAPLDTMEHPLNVGNSEVVQYRVKFHTIYKRACFLPDRDIANIIHGVMLEADTYTNRNECEHDILEKMAAAKHSSPKANRRK